MKSFYLLCLFFLSVNAVINQEAQRREAPAHPQNSYGPPQRQPVVNQQHRRLQAMHRLLQAMRSGGYSPQGRVVNRPKPIPVQNTYGPPHPPQNSYGPPQPPQNTYGPPAGGYSSSSGSLEAFTHNHNPGVSCEGWIPIPGPSISSSSGSASSGAHVDTSYGPPKHSSGGSSNTLIVVPEDTSSYSSGSGASISSSYGPPQQPHNTYGPPNTFSSGSSASSGSLASIDNSYGIPPPPVAPQNTYGTPNSFSSSGSASSSHSIDTSYGVPPEPVQPQNTYGTPNSFSSNSGSASSSHSIDSSYGVPPPPVSPQATYGTPNSFSSGSSSSSHSFNSIDTSYGVPEPPANPQSSYGPPSGSGSSYSSSGSGHSSSGSLASIDTSYGVPPEPIQPQNSYGTPKQPDNSYGPPIIVGSGHASSASAIASIDNTYGPPVAPQTPVIENNYLPPTSSGSGHSSVDTSYQGHVGHQTYGVPQNPSDFGPPESSYGPPPSGAVDFKHSSNSGNIGTIDAIPSLPTEIQLPIADSGSHFDNAIGLVSSTLGVSAGNSEVIKSHAIHESHTSEVAGVSVNSVGGSVSSVGDTYSAPPLDSYAPGKYAPSFLTRRPAVPTPPSRPIAPPRPPPRAPISPPRPQYVPPIPQKTVRPQLPPPSFRPLAPNGHAHSVAHSYSSQSHSQTIQQRPQRPIAPLLHRSPVPQGLIQSIGQNVQFKDAHRGHSAQNTYLPPPTHEVPIPPMKLVLPAPGPVHQFQSHSHSGGVATSSSSFSLQNQDLRHVHVIHDCGKGPQLSNTYGTPLAPPLTSYGPPSSGDSHSAVLSTSYEIPSQGLEVPQHSPQNFNAPSNSYGPPSNSYGPPASGPSSLDVIGLDTLESRTNAVVSQPHDSKSELPGLSSGLSSSGLDFVQAVKSHTIEIPQNQPAASNIQFHIQSSNAGHQENRIDGADHQQILADGLLQSILSAVEQQPSKTVPQVTEDAELDHSEAKTFLKSREGQQVLGDKTVTDAKKN